MLTECRGNITVCFHQGPTVTRNEQRVTIYSELLLDKKPTSNNMNKMAFQ